MQAKAVRKGARGSALKMRTVANLVRGKGVPEALSILDFLPHAATAPIKATITSAYHNLMDQNPDERVGEEDIVISEIMVDEGPVFKRFQPAPRGRAHPIQKKTSHITVVVSAPDYATEEA